MVLKDDMTNQEESLIHTEHSVHELPHVVRHITGHNADGESVFLSTDIGYHCRELVGKSAISNIIYSTKGHPVRLNNETDVKFAHGNKVSSSNSHRYTLTLDK